MTENVKFLKKIAPKDILVVDVFGTIVVAEDIKNQIYTDCVDVAAEYISHRKQMREFQAAGIIDKPRLTCGIGFF